MSAKQEILRRIARAGTIDPPPIPRDYRRTGDGSDVVAEMEEALIDYTATVSHASEKDVPAAIDAALTDCSTVVVPPGLPDAWQKGAGKGRELRVDEPALTKD